MSKTIRHTIWVSVLLAYGALVTACQPSSDKDQSGRKTSSVKGAKETAPSKVESPRTESVASPASEPAMQQRSVASTKATHAKAKADAKAKTDSKSAGKPSNTARSGYTSYGESSAGAGITEPTDSEKTVSSSTLPARKQARAAQ